MYIYIPALFFPFNSFFFFFVFLWDKGRVQRSNSPAGAVRGGAGPRDIDELGNLPWWLKEFQPPSVPSIAQSITINCGEKKTKVYRTRILPFFSSSLLPCPYRKRIPRWMWRRKCVCIHGIRTMNDKMKSPILALVVFLLKKSHRVSNTRRRFSFFTVHTVLDVMEFGTVQHPGQKKKSLSLFRGFRYILFVCPASTLYTSIILIICFKLVRYSSRHSSLFGV